jgi:hypothetical protein
MMIILSSFTAGLVERNECNAKSQFTRGSVGREWNARAFLEAGLDVMVRPGPAR